jgi:hypothetical protein
MSSSLTFEKVPFGRSHAYRVTSKEHQQAILSKLSPFMFHKEVPFDQQHASFATTAHSYKAAIQTKTATAEPVIFFLTLVDGKKCSFVIRKLTGEVFLVPFTLSGALFTEESIFEGVLFGSEPNSYDILKLIDCHKYKGASTAGTSLDFRMVLCWMTVRLAYESTPADRVSLDAETYHDFKTVPKIIPREKGLSLLLRPTRTSSQAEFDNGLRIRWNLDNLNTPLSPASAPAK